MKKCLLLLVLFPVLAKAQIEKIDLPPTIIIGEFKQGGTPLVTLSYYIADGDTTYLLRYKNLKYEVLTDYKTIDFQETGGVLQELYNTFSSSITEGKTATFKIGKTTISLEPQKAMGVKYVTAYVLDGGGYFNIAKKHLDKVFGRK